MVALGDIIITDRIPDNLILDGPISVSNNGSDPQVRYHISTGSTVPLYDTSMV
ncbi:MAG: hypothetical protein H6766_05400 [Candidatus Peribacteria bacterium]|nr:MAG: hypothetical protein H6766_05400 [Candidatus Peribacteria bacterium]